jgi:hypothetical protein
MRSGNVNGIATVSGGGFDGILSVMQRVSLYSVVHDVTIRLTEQLLQYSKQQSFEPRDRSYRLRLGEKR